MQMQKCQNFAPQMSPPANCRPGRPPSLAPSLPATAVSNKYSQRNVILFQLCHRSVNSVTTFTDKFCCVTATDIIKNKTVLYWDNIFA